MTDPSPFDLAFDAVIPPPPPKAAAKPKATPATPRGDRIVIDDPHAADPVTDVEAEAKLAAMRAWVDAIEDGIYFDLPEAIYHAVPRLSASGLQRLCVSPGTFWQGSWLDPDRPEALDEKSTDAQVLGKAYHCARLEPERFHESFVRELAKSEMPKGTLFTGTDMGRALELLGAKKSGTVAEQAERLVEYGYSGTIWHLELAEWEHERAGRTPIPADHFDKITVDMERIRGVGEINELLSGGVAEVSVFYTDRHGIKMKSRFDYLKPRTWADLKTFDNSRGKEVMQALADAMRYNRYHVQGVTYRDAAEAIRVNGLQIVGKASDAQRKLIAEIQMAPGELECWYIFQEKGGVPNLFAMHFPFWDVPTNTRFHHAGASEEAIERVEEGARTSTALHTRARFDIDKAKRAFVLYSQVYEPGTPWFPLEAVGRFSDIDFSKYWLEGTQS